MRKRQKERYSEIKTKKIINKYYENTNNEQIASASG